MRTNTTLRTLFLALTVALPHAILAEDKPADKGPSDKVPADKEPGRKGPERDGPGRDGPGRDRPGREGKDPAQLFRELDKNNDGKLTEEEVGPDRKRFFEHLLRAAGKKEGESLTHEDFLKGLQPDQRRFDGVPGMGGRPERRGDFNPGQMFDRWDKNKDGKLTKDELPDPARERLLPLFERLKKDSITREEFLSMRGGGGGGGGFNPEQLFKRLDRNEDGKISREEIPDGLRERFDRLLKLAEKKPEDSLTREEFQKHFAGSGREGDRRGMAGGGGFGRRMPIPEPAEFVKKFDKNGDGKVTLEEVDPELRRAFEAMQERLKKDPDAGLTADDLRKLRDQELAQGPDRKPGDDAGNRRPQRDGERRNPDMNDEGRRGEDRPGRPQHFPAGSPLLKLLDANHDGKITKDEISRIGELFDKLDTNHDGQLDPWELMGPPPERRMGDRGPGDRGPGDRRMGERPGKGDDKGAGEGEMRDDGKGRGDRKRPGEFGGGGRFGRRIFERQDTDKDGKISKDEAAGPLKLNFEKLDSNHDGFLDEEEVRKGMREFRLGDGEFGPGRKGPREGDGKKGNEEEGEKKSAD